MKVGILGIQGDFDKHRKLLDDLQTESIVVRYESELSSIDGLIIPGGESTTLTHIIRRTKLMEPLKLFAEQKPVFGTCAGLIMMAKSVDDYRIEPLGILDISVSRNAYGRQVFSFSETIELSDIGKQSFATGTFIRAPRIKSLGTTVEILAHYHGEPVAVQEGAHIGLSFHPELDNELYFHKMFLAECESKINFTDKSNVA